MLQLPKRITKFEKYSHFQPSSENMSFPSTQETVKGIKYTFFHSFPFLHNDEKIGEVDIVVIRHLRVCPIAGYI